MTTATLPRQRTRTKRFSGTEKHVSQARAWVTGIVADTGRTDDIIQVVGELAANAVQHSMSGFTKGTYTITVTLSETSVTVEVADAGETLASGLNLPIRPVDESGRGLLMVTELADGFERHGSKATATFNLSI